MKKFKFFISLNIILLILSSCGTFKESFQNQKKNSTDEFLVEKKSPLVMPPDFDKLPIPNNENKNNDYNDNIIKKLISDKKNNKNLSETNNNLDGSILNKIKNK